MDVLKGVKLDYDLISLINRWSVVGLTSQSANQSKENLLVR